jgi:hypothetical protein
MKKLVKLVLILMTGCPLIGAAVFSCAGESDCSTAGRAMLWSAVYKRTTAEKDTLDSLTVSTLQTDIILNKAKNVTRFGLPLKYTNDTTTWIFHYSSEPGDTDTLMIRHTNTPKFVSMECGYEMKQVVLDLSVAGRHRLDSIRITNSTTNTDETKNLELYFKD